LPFPPSNIEKELGPLFPPTFFLLSSGSIQDHFQWGSFPFLPSSSELFPSWLSQMVTLNALLNSTQFSHLPLIAPKCCRSCFAERFLSLPECSLLFLFAHYVPKVRSPSAWGTGLYIGSPPGKTFSALFSVVPIISWLVRSLLFACLSISSASIRTAGSECRRFVFSLPPPFLRQVRPYDHNLCSSHSRRPVPLALLSLKVRSLRPLPFVCSHKPYEV